MFCKELCFCVVSMDDNIPQRSLKAQSFQHAVNIAIKEIQEIAPKLAKNIPEMDLQEELEQDACWADGNIWIYILPLK